MRIVWMILFMVMSFMFRFLQYTPDLDACFLHSIFYAEHEFFCKKHISENGVYCEGPNEWLNSKRESLSQ